MQAKFFSEESNHIFFDISVLENPIIVLQKLKDDI